MENLPFSLDIQSGVQMAVFLAALIAVLSLISGIRGIYQGQKLQFFRMRRERMVAGWRRIFLALFLGLVSFLLYRYAEPVTYSFYEPSPTPTLTPSITLTPSVTQTPSPTLSPTITDTPSETNTPTITPTPRIPLPLEGQFEGELTPPAGAVFSQFEFTSLGLDALNRPLEPTNVFTNPVGSMYAAFSYDGMVNGLQWTALWYRENDLVNYETVVWDGDTGGYGFTEWQPRAEEWLPGEYQVQIFVGYDWYQVGFFSVVGDPPTPTVTITPSPTVTPTPSDTPTPTVTSTPTPTPTSTQTPTSTSTPSRTPSLTPTPSETPDVGTVYPTDTPTATETKKPTATKTPVTPTKTRWPTATRVTPSPTITRWPTATRVTPSPTITKWLTHTNTPTPNE